MKKCFSTLCLVLCCMMAAVGTTWAQTNNTIDLSTVNSDITVPDGYTLTGTLDVANYPVKISIDYDATVTLSNVTIIGVDNQNYKWAGITCLGDATLILVGTNTLKGFESHYPGIYVPVNSTLTLQGTGSLTASGNDDGAGIGGGSSNDCGNIVIAGGTITATGGGVCAPGIGAGYGASCGTINISGGNVTAKGALYAPGIGVGYEGSCDAISISGGTITAKGGNYAAGIGAGYHGSSCVSIDITGGIVTAIGGTNAAGIGTGQESSCGPITITNGVTQVTATKGVNSPNSIGEGGTSTCNTVTIGGTVYWDGSNYPNGGNNAQTGIVKSPYYYPIQNYTLTNIPSGWTVTTDGQTVPFTDGNASIQSGATVVLTPSGSDKPRVKSVTLTDPLTISLTVTKLTDGSWTFTMPVGNRTLNVEWWGMCDLAWMLGDQPVPSEGVTVCLGFENLLTLPTLSNPHNLDVRYGSTNENVARFDEGGFIIIDELSAGATTIYVVHDADEDYLYDSAYYMLTVLAPDTLTLAVNNSAMGAVSLVDTPDHVIPITTTAGTFKVIPGTNVNVIATPAEHHYMQKWNNEAALNSNVAVNTTFTVTKDTTLTAYFVHKPILTLKSNPSSGNAGHVDVDSVNHALPAGVVASNDTVYKYIVDYDTTVTVKAIPAPHYHLASWNNTGGNDLQQEVTITQDMEITGVFAIDTFTLTLKTNDINKGTVEVTNHNGNPAIVSHDPDANGTRTYKVNHGAEVIIKAMPKNHYQLASWSNGATVNQDDTIHVIVTNDSTVTANFSPDTYTVTYYLNGGTISGDTVITYTYGEASSLPSPEYIGHTFVGWYTDPNLTDKVDEFLFWAAAYQELWAKWTVDTFNVTLITNGGTINSGNVNSYIYGEGATLPTDVTRTGYTFGGWYTNENFSEYFKVTSISTTSIGTVTLYAKWIANTYHVTLNTNGGTINSGDVSSYTYGEGANLPTDVTRTGHTFDGWYTNANLTGDAVTSIPATAIGDTAFWAKWNINSYTIAASANPMEGGTVTGAGSYEYSANVTLTAAYNPGYHFVNWIEADTVYSTEANITVKATGNRTLTAHFELSSYNVTASVANTADVRGTVQIAFTNANNQAQTVATTATVTSVQATALGGSTTTLTAIPETGYNFVNWTNGDVILGSNAVLTTTEALTATANFDANSYTITYMDGETELNVDTFKYRQPITGYVVSRVGWDFIGWSPAVPELMPAENLTVYAQWSFVCDSVKDIDNNTYPSVKIGNICWMAANLKATRYSDGRSIANIYEYQSPMYPNVAENVNLNGLLYNWYDAIDTATLTVSTRVQGICPSGWYLPNAEDLAVLSAVPTPELRSTTGWIGCDGNTNSTGFTAYPAGMYSSSRARYEGMGTETSWWSTIDPDPSTVITPTLVITAKALCDSYFCDVIFTKSYLPADAISVRCVKRGE